MAESTMYRYYKQLPDWAKGVTVVGTLVIVFFVGKRIYKAVFPTEQDKKNKELAKNIDNEISTNSQKGLKPTFLDSNYTTFANTIYNSMRYVIGDDYAAVEDILKKMNNDLDVSKLIKSFGYRQDYAFGIPAGSPMDLFTYVRKELGNDYAGITDYRLKRVNADWLKKGITYKI